MLHCVFTGTVSSAHARYPVPSAQCPKCDYCAMQWAQYTLHINTLRATIQDNGAR